MLKTRTYKIFKNQNYKIPSIGLLKEWKWSVQLTPSLVIGTYRIGFVKFQNGIDMKVIRDYARDLIPMTPEETKIAQLENLLYGYQLTAIEWYGNMEDYNEFYNTIFNQHLDIYLDFGSSGPDSVDIEETYYDRKSVNP